jgi:hypothetical protein
MTTPSEKKPGIDATWIAIGIGVGVAIGVATNNLALWLGLGVAIGSIGPIMHLGRKKGGK